MPGSCRAIALSLSTLLACSCADVFAAEPPGKRPLQLKLSSVATTTAMRPQVSGSARPARFRVADKSLGQRALDSLLDDAQEQSSLEPSRDGASFKFNRRGNAGRDLQQGYRNLCDSVTRKVWEDPNGKRVRFDVAGKPGVGIEIPLR